MWHSTTFNMTRLHYVNVRYGLDFNTRLWVTIVHMTVLMNKESYHRIGYLRPGLPVNAVSSIWLAVFLCVYCSRINQCPLSRKSPSLHIKTLTCSSTDIHGSKAHTGSYPYHNGVLWTFYFDWLLLIFSFFLFIA